MNEEPIATEKLAKARRRCQRLCGSVILHAMAETDTSFYQIGDRLGVDADRVKDWVMKYAECEIEDGVSLNVVSAILYTMNCELDIRYIMPAKPQAAPASDKAPETA